MHIFLIVVLAIISSVLIGSLLEWIVHGPMEHGKLSLLLGMRDDHIRHHTWFGKKEGFVNYNHGKSVALPIWAFLSVMAFVSLLAWLFGYLIGSWVFTGVFIATSLLHYIAFQYLHTSMHIPKGRWIESTRWFKRRCAEHKVHHAFDEVFEKPVNICVVVNLADKVFGTTMEQHNRQK